MKKIILVLFLILCPIFCNAENFDLNSKNVVLYNLNDNRVLYEQNKDEKVSIASMTKILTAMTVIENQNNLQKTIKLTNNDFKKINELNLATAGFKVGDTVTYEDLLYGLLFPSGAECAFALSNNTFSTYDEFINKMNNLAKKIGMKNSSFTNPVGYDEENHYSTVNDVYLLFKYAMNNKVFKNIITDKSYTTSNNIVLKNNVINKYKKISGKNYLVAGKTGTTKKAGYALASIIKEGKVNLMLVTTNTPFDYKAYYNFLDAKTIYEYYLNNYEYKNVAKKNQILTKVNTKYAKENKALITTDKNLEKYVNKKTSNIVYSYKGQNDLTPFIKKGSKVGIINVYVDDVYVGKVNAILKEKLTFSLVKYLKAHKIFSIIISIVILIIIIKIYKLVKKCLKRN